MCFTIYIVSGTDGAVLSLSGRLLQTIKDSRLPIYPRYISTWGDDLAVPGGADNNLLIYQLQTSLL